MTEHRLLTGASLHEPKGVESATNGQVYVANGSGSGVWMDRYNGITNLNTFNFYGTIDDISTASSGVFFYIPRNCSINRVSFVLYGTITAADSTVSFYRNGALLAPTLTIPYVGSISGTSGTQTFSPALSFTTGQIFEARTDGLSDNAVKCHLMFDLTAT